MLSTLLSGPAASSPSEDSSPATSSAVNVHKVAGGTLNRKFRVTVTHASDLPTDPNIDRASGIIQSPPAKSLPLPEGSPLTPSVDYIVVATPPGFTLLGAAAASGDWSVRIDPDRRDAYLSGGQLHPGRTVTIILQANVPSPPQDVTREWVVIVSNDDGGTARESAPAKDGALLTTILGVSSN